MSGVAAETICATILATIVGLSSSGCTSTSSPVGTTEPCSADSSGATRVHAAGSEGSAQNASGTIPDSPASVASSWGAWSPGPHAVGLRMDFVADPVRGVHDIFGESRRHRSLLRAIWYPAQPDSGRPMVVADYHRLESLDGANAHPLFTGALQAQLRGVLIEGVAGIADFSADQARLHLDDLPSQHVRKFRESPVLARAEASALPGEGYPVVVYHAGYGGSYADNFAMCEYLASHGYVVISASFHEPGAADPSIGGFEHSHADIPFLLSRLPGDIPVDIDRRAIVGHSFGAQVATSLIGRDPGMQAVVSLDTTFEYHALSERSSHTQAQYELAESVRTPILFMMQDVGRDQAFARQFESAPREWVRLHGAEHVDFTTFVAYRDGPDSSSPKARMYSEIVRHVRRFLDRHLRSGPPFRWAPKLEVGADYQHLPAEEGARPRMSEILAQWPESGAQGALGPCENRPACAFHGSALIDALMATGHAKEGCELAELIVTTLPESWRVHQAAGSAALQCGDRTRALRWFRQGLDNLGPAREDESFYIKHLRSVFELSVRSASR